MFPIGLLAIGERGQIVAVREPVTHGGHGRVEDIGLRVGKTVEVLTNGGRGPILLKVDESRIAIARRMAMQIFVRRQG